MNSSAPTFRIHFTNFGYSSSESPSSFIAAVAVAKRAGFDASISQDGHILATYSALYGLRMVPNALSD